MPFRRIRAKKYAGISEYFRTNDNDKKTIAYYIDYRDIDDKRKKVKVDARDRDEALVILKAKNLEVAKIKEKILKGEEKLHQLILNDKLSLDDLALKFHAKRVGTHSKQDEKRYLKHISPTLGKKKISKINKDDILKLHEVLQQSTYTRHKIVKNDQMIKTKSISETVKLSPVTIKAILEYLRGIFNWAIEENFIKSNPVFIKKIINQNDDTEPGRVLTDEELDTLWNLDELIVNDRLYLFLKTCYFTGARPAAVMDIQVKHINFSAKKIKLKAMKKGKSYEATVNDELLNLLKKWISKHQLTHSNFIFYPVQSYLRATSKADKQACKNKRSNYSGYQRILRKIFDPVFNIGIDSYDLMYRVTVYTMRRTAGTKIYKSYGIVHAKKFLNHTDIKTTMTYLNIEDDTDVLIDAL